MIRGEYKCDDKSVEKVFKLILCDLINENLKLHGNQSWADFTWYNELSDQWIFLKENLCHKKPKVTRH